MQFEEHTTKSVKHASALTAHYIWTEVIFALVALGLSVMGALFSVFITTSPGSSKTDIVSTGQRLSLFIGGLIVLAAIIVSIATFIRRKNRDVIFLKQRLAEIYLSALRKSAFNPQLESPTSDE